MNKKELVARIAQSTGLPQAQVARALDSTILLIEEELIDKPKKTSRALDSEIQLIRDPLTGSGKRTKALDSTIDLIDPALVESGKKSGRALDSTIELIPEHLVAVGKKVRITGFGTFYTAARKARVGRNSRTGAKVRIEARIVPKFKPSKRLIDKVNK